MSFYFAFKDYNPPPSNKVLLPVSIVVCFKNEEKNISRLLDFLCEQDYPDYEIIMVDDYSDDASVEFIAAYDDPKIKLIKAGINIPGKKAALETGIKHAKNNIIALTDADCEGNLDWLKHIVKSVPDNGCVLGYAPIYPSDSIVSIFASYESWLTGVQYLSYAILKNPYMGVGRNMAYYKDMSEIVHAIYKTKNKTSKNIHQV
jgi:glycosyltransferase involved in cell wall biosynthesis